SKKSKRREAKIKEVKAKESSEDDAKVKRKSAIPAPQNDPVKMENAGATKASNGRYVVPNVLIDEDPLPNCRFAFDGVDQFNGGVRREMEEEILFTHTDPRLRAYLKGREYVTAEAYLSSVAGGYRYLTLTVRIASKNARREYGSLRSSSLLNIRLLDGSIVSLFSQDGSSGTIDPQSGDLVYKVLYGIDYQKTKLLAKSEVDQVRIVWSSGYEDYEVYNVDFFTRQLDCLNAKLE
nr:hypothetical protein [Saprospiraceae bacterium]